jgi:hypothetical protein
MLLKKSPLFKSLSFAFYFRSINGLGKVLETQRSRYFLKLLLEMEVYVSCEIVAYYAQGPEFDCSTA